MCLGGRLRVLVVNSRFVFFGRLLTEDMARPTEMSTLMSTAASNVVHARVRPLFRHIADHSVRLLVGSESVRGGLRACNESDFGSGAVGHHPCGYRMVQPVQNRLRHRRWLIGLLNAAAPAVTVATSERREGSKNSEQGPNADTKFPYSSAAHVCQLNGDSPNSLIRSSNAVDTGFGAREVGAGGPCRA